MQTLDHDEVSAVISASPQALYGLVADVTRMPELSPEVRACRWLNGATAPAVGVRFEASNKTARGPAWKNRPVITIADPGREFAFARAERLVGTIVWSYRFEPADHGATRVTESYQVTKPVSRLGWFILENIYGRRDRRADLRQGMTATLARLAAFPQ